MATYEDYRIGHDVSSEDSWEILMGLIDAARSIEVIYGDREVTFRVWTREHCRVGDHISLGVSRYDPDSEEWVEVPSP